MTMHTRERERERERHTFVLLRAQIGQDHHLPIQSDPGKHSVSCEQLYLAMQTS